MPVLILSLDKEQSVQFVICACSNTKSLQGAVSTVCYLCLLQYKVFIRSSLYSLLFVPAPILSLHKEQSVQFVICACSNTKSLQGAVSTVCYLCLLQSEVFTRCSLYSLLFVPAPIQSLYKEQSLQFVICACSNPKSLKEQSVQFVICACSSLYKVQSVQFVICACSNPKTLQGAVSTVCYLCLLQSKVFTRSSLSVQFVICACSNTKSLQGAVSTVCYLCLLQS